jgi:hypothetical protein
MADGDSGAHNGTPTFETGGVLRIDPDEKDVPTIWLSPAYWRQITEDISHDPVKADYYRP